MARKTKVVRLYRWRHPVFGFENFGDEITSVILERLFGLAATPASLTHAELIGAGSILDMYDLSPLRNLPLDRTVCRLFGSRELHVWGAGFLGPGTSMVWPQRVHLHAVRGALSAERLAANGVVRGDPGILASLLIGRTPASNRVGIVPHWKDYRWARRHLDPELPRHWTLINPLASVDTVLKDIAASDYVVSSSLHGLIAADSFDKPCVWVSARTKSVGNGTFKFEDYQTTRGSMFNVPVTYQDIVRMSEEQIHRVASRVNRNVADWQRELIASFPFP